MAKFVVVDSGEIDPEDLRAARYVDVDGLSLVLHRELEKINLRRKRLREELTLLDAEAARIEAQRKG